VSGAIVGTYRMQLGDVAGRNFGYYSEQEFCFAPYEGMRSQIVELGAGVHSS
jgi:putative hemolysin